MAKHSEQLPGETQVRYILNSTRLRLARFQLVVSDEGGGIKQHRVFINLMMVLCGLVNSLTMFI